VEAHWQKPHMVRSVLEVVGNDDSDLAILKSAGKLSFTNPSALFTQLSHLFEDEVGGTSGAVGSWSEVLA